MTFVKFVPKGACLIRHAATAVAALGERDLRHVVTILPTARLGHVLLAALAEQKGALMPPKLHTVAGFFRAIDRQLDSAEPPLPALPPQAATLWLKALLSAEHHRGSGRENQGLRRYKTLAPHHAGELLVFYKELIETGLWDTWFAALARYVEQECYHHEGHLEAVMARFVDIHGALTAWREQIIAAGWQPQVDDEAARAQRVAAFIQAGGLAGQTVVVAGLTSMAASWLPVFTALAEQGEDCRFILPEPPQLIAREHPMAELLAAVLGKEPAQQALSAGRQPALDAAYSAKRAAEDIVMVEAEDGIAEVDFVLTTITELLAADASLKPAEIAVLVPSESAYSGLLTTRLTGKAFAVNAAIAQPLSASALGSWWLSLCGALAAGTEPLALYHTLRQPFTQRLIHLLFPPGSYGPGSYGSGTSDPCTPDPGSSGPGGLGPGFWQQVYRLITAAKPLPRMIDLNQLALAVAEHRPQEAGAFRRLCQGYERLLALCGGGGAGGTGSGAGEGPASLLRPLQKWLTITYEQAMTKTLRAAPLEQSAFTALRELLAGLCHLDLARQPLGPSELWAHIREASQAMTIRVTGEPMAGVQILSLAEARWLPMRVAFVLGCSEGFFPRGLPTDELMTDTLKKRLGLKGWQGLEAMEDLSFSLLTARVPKVFLCRSLSFAGEDKVPSRFIEHLQGQRHHPVIAPQGGSRPAPKRQDGVFAQIGAIPAGWHHDGAAPWLSRVSATAVDRFIGCPYRFAIDSLNLSCVDLPFDDTEAIDQGVVLHELFEQFHEGAPQLSLKPLPRRLKVAEARARLTERFATLLTAHLGEQTSPDSAQLAAVGGPRYIDHLLSLCDQQGEDYRLPAGESERQFAGDGTGSAEPEAAPVITLAGAKRHLRGQVDRLDLAAGGVVITDYKRDSIPKPSPSAGPASAQLLLYADGLAALGLADRERMILGYWSMLKGEWSPVAVGDEIREEAKARGLVKKTTPTIAQQWQLMEDHFRHREQQVDAAGRYLADDEACGFCRYGGLCRRGDPRHGQAAQAAGEAARW